MFRAYYGMRTRLTRADGAPTGAAFAFMTMLLPTLAAARPDDIFVCVFDSSRITFRQDIYPEYKAHRPPLPDDLIAQIELTRDAARATGMPVLCVPGVEADDVIATLARQYCATTDSVRIITSDKDLMQLVSDCIYLYDGMKEVEVRAPGVFEKFGVRPDQVIDVQSLMGDASDNVPGVPGIGPKKAAELINQFGSLDALYKNLDGVQSDRVRQLLIDNMEQAYVSQKLVTLKDDVDLDGLKLCPFVFDKKSALEFVRHQIESNALAARIEKLFPNDQATPAPTQAPECFIPPEFLPADDEVARPTPITTAPINFTFETITTIGQLEQFLGTVKNILALDTETTGLDQMADRIVGISLAADSLHGIYIPIRHKKHSDDLFDTESSVPEQLSLDTVREKLWPYLTNPDIVKVGHNLKYDLHILANEGWDVYAIAPFDDTMLQSYVLHGTLHSHSLDELARTYLGHENITFASLFPPKTKSADMRFDYLDIAAAAPYAAEDATVCFALYELFTPQLDLNEKLKKLYENCDRPLMPILLRMERTGVLVDRARLGQLSMTFHATLSRLESEIWNLAGHEFNIASPKQLATILFEELKLPANKKMSTDADALAELSEHHPIIEKVLEWRSIAKLAGTYADALPRQIASDGRIHTTYLQTSTNTGRLSSRDPNLQNIPIKTELGTEIRKCFIAPAGRVLISADYSQIQLRLLADVANVKTFKETFLSNKDIHEQTARQIFNIPDSTIVPKDSRRAAKTVNFSIIYGISSFGLAAQLNVPRSEAQGIINAYMSGLPEIKIYMDHIKDFAMSHSCVYTPWGRRIELPDVNNPRLRSYAMRAAVNAPIQGFEADLMRFAMVKINENLGISDQESDGLKMIMQVHDEIVFECPAETAEHWAKKIKFEMENVAKLSVPLLAEYNIDTSWDK